MKRSTNKLGLLPLMAFALATACGGTDTNDAPLGATPTVPLMKSPAVVPPAASAEGTPDLSGPRAERHRVQPGTSWARESVHPIEWNKPSDLGEVDDAVTIEVSYDAGATFSLLKKVAVNEEHYKWIVPASGPAHGRVRVSFRRTDANGVEKVLREEVTPDVTFEPSQKRSYEWEKVTSDAPWGARDGAGGVVFGGKMWLIGGWNGDRFPLTCANDVWSSVDGKSWSLEKPNTFTNAETFDRASDWEGRHFAGYQVFGGQMWIVGGDPVQGHYQTDVWSSFDGRKWTRRDVHRSRPKSYLVTDVGSATFGQREYDLSTRPAEEAQFGLRTLHITGVFQDKLFVMGGQRISQFVRSDWPGGPAKVFDDVWSSSDGATFTQVKTKGPMWAPRALVSNVVEHQGRMWLIGGGAYEDPEEGRMGREYRNDVWSTKDGATWEPVVDVPPFSPRIWHNVQVFDGRLWVINGYDGHRPGRGRAADNLRDVWYSSDGKNWYEASPPEAFVPRHAGTAWVKDGALWVGAGNAIGAPDAGQEGYKWNADVWKMSPSIAK